MQLINRSMAGTLESSDAQISIAPGNDGIVLHIQSTVQNQYGRAIKQSVLDTLSKLGIENAEVDVNDRGALECTLRARVECAAYRSAGIEAGIPWEEM